MGLPAKALPIWIRALRVFAVFSALLFAVEGASFGVLGLLAWRDRARPVPHSPTMSAYRNQLWADVFWREQRKALSYEVYPYGLWRSRPFSGATIVVDAAGVRQTAHSQCSGDVPTVYVLGGSTVWGYGSPDWETIPSHLAKRFAAEGRPTCVINLGEDSWRSDQGVIKLILELKRPGARRPNFIVFLNGCNDVFTPFFLTGRVDWEWDFQQTKDWVDELARMRESSLRYLRITNTWKMGQRLVRQFKGSAVWQMPPNPDRLAREIVENHLANLRIVESLSHNYGFRYAFFWQPLSIAGHKILTAEESEGTRLQLGHWYEPGRLAVGKTLQLLRAAATGHVHDLTGAFDARTDSVYIDTCHLLPVGNSSLADRIYEVIK
jgi:hypothetical protein